MRWGAAGAPVALLRHWAHVASFVLSLLAFAGAADHARAAKGNSPSPLTSIHELLEAHGSRGQVLVRGAVTYSGREVIVQDQTGAIAVSSATPASLTLGDQVEVEGSLQLHNGVPRIESASIRNLWTGSTPLPLAISPDEAAEGAYNGMLVAIEGELVRASAVPNGGMRLTLGSGDQLFSCILEAGAAAVPVSLTPGETLRCTGVLSVNQTERAFESGTFLVLLRDGADLHLLVPAPWWTPRHLVLCFLGLLPLAFLSYRLHLRSMRARMALVVEERSRIAREIHDTLAQGFSGIALQLQAVQHTMGQQPAVTQEHLAMALQMVRRSRAEAHRSIATLRTLHSQENPVAMLDKLLRQLTDPAGLVLRVEEKGTPFTLPDELCSQLLRIAQEAVANTVQHAHARNLTATIHYSEASLILLVADDGCGFNVDTAGSVDSGHFGIAGMHERATQIGAAFSIYSSGEGTALRLEVPIVGAHTRPARTRFPWTILPGLRLHRPEVAS